MTLKELVEKVGGEYVRGMARVRQGNEYIVIGKHIDGELQMTAAGVEMAKTLETSTKKRGRPRKAEAVEAPESTEDFLDDVLGLVGEEG
jgi:hypothetical protein